MCNVFHGELNKAMKNESMNSVGCAEWWQNVGVNNAHTQGTKV